jgi:hypothetical protein
MMKAAREWSKSRLPVRDATSGHDYEQVIAFRDATSGHDYEQVIAFRDATSGHDYEQVIDAQAQAGLFFFGCDNMLAVPQIHS